MSRISTGGLIDRSKQLSFRFDGSGLQGYAGDTLASALLANDVRLVARSFKYHRPRGILTAGSEEPNALVELRSGARREPNTRATVAELFDGLEASSQNRFPSLGFDLGSINGLFSPLLVAGFYYKTFMWPAAFWERVYEPLIRRAAGLGRAATSPDPDRYDKAHAFCDVLVIGAGPAGLAAALRAARSGARVILCDEDFLFGGRLNAEQHEIDGMPGAGWARAAVAELGTCSNVTLLSRTTVFGVYDGNTYGALERVADHLAVPGPGQPRQRAWKIVAKRTILAAGAVERPLVFGGNDRPGVMMASAVRTYVNRFAVRPGTQAAIFTCTDDGWRTAFDLQQAGVAVDAIIDARHEVAPPLLNTALRARLRVMTGAVVTATSGGKSLRGVTVRTATGHIERLDVDLLAMSGGWTPSVALTTHLGGRPRWADAIASFVPGDLLPFGMAAVGAATGAFALPESLRQGSIAAAEAVEALGYKAAPQDAFRASNEASSLTPLWQVRDTTGKAFVDFQHDVTRDDVELAAREGYRSVELLKRYTTLGMATDQGRTSNINGHAILAEATGRVIPDVGTTVARPPYTPVAIGAFAGHHRGKQFRPTRFTAGHRWAVERGATFVEAGQWLRAQWFAQPGETDWLTSVSREVRQVRGSVGVSDVSTLGKIDVQGSDAGVFLDRVYSNLFSTLPVGKARYGLMLREDGFVFDDGTSARFAPDHYVMSTTTVNAARVMQHLEHARQVLWPELDVQLASVTEQWAQYAVAGPQARRVLERLLGSSIDLDDAAFPYLACAEFTWNGVPARLFRISFSGELAYELAVPARYGDATIRAIMAAGAAFDIVPYGLEALSVMRIEKGHVAGSELNGQTTAADLGLGKMMSKKKDFIGRTLAMRPGVADPARPALVGVKPVDRRRRLRSGVHFIAKGATASLGTDQGYVTSVAFSPMLDHWIALGFLSNGAARIGERLRAHDPLRNEDFEVEICSQFSLTRKESASMSDLLPRAPLDAVVPHGANGAGIVVQDCDGAGLALVQVRKDKAAELAVRVEAQFGLELPVRPARMRNGAVAFACTAPGTWLASKDGAGNAFATLLQQALRGAASVTDQSDGFALLRLSGPSLQTVLSRMVPVDLHPRAFICDDVAATVIGHIGVLLWRIDDATDGTPRFEVALFRSLVESFWHTLSDAAAEVGLSISSR